jgi:response regulator RpfG family c-di-GMP phosphodiesterase
MLDKLHDFTAAIIVRHHQYGPKPYPVKLPALPEWLEPKKAVIDGAARILALADYYDALMNRKNDKNKSKKKGKPPLTGDQKRELFYQDNADKGRLIQMLEEVGILKFPDVVTF